MDFKLLKAHISRKKQPKTDKNWFTIEFKDDKTIHIIDQKMLEILLVDTDNSLQALMSCGWTKNLGWHEGNDGRIYERHELNEAGNNYYDRLDFQKHISEIGPKYIKLLNEINDYKLPSRDDNVKLYMYWRIRGYFRVNEIEGIKKYTGKELKQGNKKVEILH